MAKKYQNQMGVVTLLYALLCIGDALHLRTDMMPVPRRSRRAARGGGLPAGHGDGAHSMEVDDMPLPQAAGAHIWPDPSTIERRGRKRRGSGSASGGSRRNAKSKRNIASSPHGPITARMNGDLLRQIARSAGDAEPLWKMRSANRDALREIDGNGSTDPLSDWEGGHRREKVGQDLNEVAGAKRKVTVDIVLMTPKPEFGAPIKLAECLDVKVKGVEREMTWEQFTARLDETPCTLRQPQLPGMNRENHLHEMPVIKEGFEVKKDVAIGEQAPLAHATVTKICLKPPQSPWPMWEEVNPFREGSVPFRLGDHDQQLTPEKIPPFLPPIVMGKLDQWRAQPSPGKSLFAANLRNMPLVKVEFTAPEGWSLRNLQPGAP